MMSLIFVYVYSKITLMKHSSKNNKKRKYIKKRKIIKHKNYKSTRKTISSKQKKLSLKLSKSKKSKRKIRTRMKTKKMLYYNKKGGYMKTCTCVDYDVAQNQYNLIKNPTAKQCTSSVVEGTNFCQKHQNCPAYIKSLTSGYEHQYQPEDWKHPYIEGSHNCYTYFLNNKIKAVHERCDELCKKHNKTGCPKKVDQCSNLKPQPGDYHQLLKHGNLNKGPNKYKCPLMETRIMGDNDTLKKVRFDAKCPKYHYKGAMVVDPDHTYHFYRQNNDGAWSHKPGTLPVTNKDADDKVIYVPHNADRNYNKSNKKDGINYTDFCGYYCIPNNKYLNTHSI
jgi:hypothetical protein